MSIVLEMNMTMNETELKISTVCDDIKELLIHKNRKYGNSALKPNRIFSKCSATEQLLVRIDDNNSKNFLNTYIAQLRDMNFPRQMID